MLGARQISTALLATVLVAPGAHAFFRMNCAQPVVTMRADPIVNPNVVSGHVHQILGGNGFNFNQTYEQARSSTCSTCQAREDLSNYWTPNLFFRNKNGQVTPVPQIGGGTIYYLQRRANDNEKLVAFPPGFRMVAGNPTKRSFDPNSKEQKAISFVCLDYAGSGAGGEWNDMPDHMCPNGLRAQVFFPSCWDGKNTDSTDHKSHMAYPSGTNSGSCPSTHPVRTISLFFEITFDVPKFKDQWWRPSNAKHPWVWSFGDVTGYGFHGDFLNGWNINALQRAIDKCNQNSGVIEDCKADLPLRTDDEMHNCILPPRVNEKTRGLLDKLPGCNDITAGPADAVMKPGCPLSGPGAANLILSPNEASYLRNDIQGWKPVGCAIDDGPQRVLPERFTNGAMTPEVCTSHCKSKGFSFAGLEWGQECWCGNSLDKSKVGSYACDQECEGDADSYCGASRRLAVYQQGAYTPPPPATITTTKPSAPSSTPKPPSPPPATPTTAAVAGFKVAGCFVDNKEKRVLKGTALFNGKPMTPAVCTAHCTTAGFKLAGVEFGKECFCGNTVPQQLVAESQCNTACVGDAQARCGAADRILVYESQHPTTPTPPIVKPGPQLSKAPAGFTSLGCFVDSTQARTLRGSPLFRAQPMTASVCTAHCTAKGFKFAGIEYGAECFCGHEIVNKKSAPGADCNMACAGDKNSSCGAGNRVQIFQRQSKRSLHVRRLVQH